MTTNVFLAAARNRAATNMTVRQLAVMHVVATRPAPHTVRGLAAELNVSKPAITRALDALEADKLASRTTDPEDRRSVLVSLTAAGTKLLKGLTQ